MDFDIGTLVYIFLTLIFLIVGVMGKKKKPNPQIFDRFNEEKEDQKSFPDNLEKTFGKILGEEEKERDIEPAYQEFNTSGSEKADFLQDTAYDKIEDLPSEYNKIHEDKDEDKIYKLEDHIEEIARKTKLGMIPRKRSDSSFVTKAIKDFDPQKAYLYSQIFEPKYF